MVPRANSRGFAGEGGPAQSGRGDVSHRRAALMKLVLSYGREGAEMTDALEKLDQNQQGHEHIPSNRPQRNQRTEHHERAHIERVATHAARRLYRANLDSD